MALCGRFGKSANLCISCDALCSAPADRWVLCDLEQNDAVKPISLTLIKSYFSEHKIFLHQLLKGKPRGIEFFIKLICVANVWHNLNTYR